jgi:hypothetical protein
MPALSTSCRAGCVCVICRHYPPVIMITGATSPSTSRGRESDWCAMILYQDQSAPLVLSQPLDVDVEVAVLMVSSTMSMRVVYLSSTYC